MHIVWLVFALSSFLRVARFLRNTSEGAGVPGHLGVGRTPLPICTARMYDSRLLGVLIYRSGA